MSANCWDGLLDNEYESWHLISLAGGMMKLQLMAAIAIAATHHLLSYRHSSLVGST